MTSKGNALDLAPVPTLEGVCQVAAASSAAHLGEDDGGGGGAPGSSGAAASSSLVEPSFGERLEKAGIGKMPKPRKGKDTYESLVKDLKESADSRDARSLTWLVVHSRNEEQSLDMISRIMRHVPVEARDRVCRLVYPQQEGSRSEKYYDMTRESIELTKKLKTASYSIRMDSNPVVEGVRRLRDEAEARSETVTLRQMAIHR